MSKILMMNNGYPTIDNPKHSSYIKIIYSSLVCSGHEVDLLVLNSSFTNKTSHLFKYFKFYIKILKFNFSKFDYIYLHHYGQYALPLFFKLKDKTNLVLHWHGEDLFPTNFLFKFLFKFFFLKLPHKTKHIVPSHYYKKELIKKFDFDPYLISISPSGGIDTNLFALKKFIFSNNSIRLGFASGLSFGKGADFLVKLLKDRNIIEKKYNLDIYIDFINYGKDKKYFLPILSSQKNVTIWDPMDTFKMVSFYHSIDILIFPTRRKQESLGLVSLEAMSCGVPVLGPSNFAVPEYIIPSVSGELFESENYQDFKIQLEKMIINFTTYSPRDIVISKYSQVSVSKFYSDFF